MSGSAYDAFTAALKNKSPATLSTYDDALKYYMGTQGFTEYDQLLADPAKDIQERIKNLLEQLTYAKSHKVLAALRKFYAANEVIINWEHVKLFKPSKPETEHPNRPYSMDEMLTFYKAASLREQVAQLIMGTGAPRVGALPGIRIDKDLIFVEDYKLYACLIYPLSSTSRYITFFTPQASKLIDEYKGRREKGYLFVNKREPNLPIGKSTLTSAIWETLVKSGLRQPGDDKTVRHDVQLDHGFRKFCRTGLGNADIKIEYAEMLTGHGAQLVRIYDIPTARQWLERTEYHRAVPFLTLPL